MSGTHQPVKGSKVVSPLTGRNVAVGGVAWRKLVREGYLPNVGYLPSETFLDTYDLSNPASATYKIKKAQATLPKGYSAVKGRGKHRGTIQIARKRMKKKEITAQASKAVARKVKKIYNDDDSLSDLDEADLEAMFQQAIDDELASQALSDHKKVRKPHKKYIKKPTVQFESESEESEPEGETQEGFEEITELEIENEEATVSEDSEPEQSDPEVSQNETEDDSYGDPSEPDEGDDHFGLV